MYLSPILAAADLFAVFVDNKLAFKPMVDFDRKWPHKLDREAIDELFTLGFMKTGHNGVLAGPNGIGKMMILKTLPTRLSYAPHRPLYSGGHRFESCRAC